MSPINDISLSHGTFTPIRIRALRHASWSTSFMDNKLHCVLTISRKLSDTSSTRNSRVASSHQRPPAGGTQGATSVPLTLQSNAHRATERQCLAENLASGMVDLNSLYPFFCLLLAVLFSNRTNFAQLIHGLAVALIVMLRDRQASSSETCKLHASSVVTASSGAPCN